VHGPHLVIMHATLKDHTLPSLGWRSYHLLQLGFWLVFAAVLTVAILSAPPDHLLNDLPPEVTALFYVKMDSLRPIIWSQHGLVILCGLGVTHLLHLLSAWQRWMELPLRQLVPRVLLSCVGLGMVMATAVSLLSWYGIAPHYGLSISLRDLQDELLSTAVVASFLLIAWAALYYACQAFAHLAALQVRQLQQDAAVKDARLAVITTQLNPHFLFNSLNAVRGLIEEQPDRARDAVTQLAHVLRASLSSAEQRFTSVKAELATVDALLELEHTRHGERLRMERQVDPGSLQAQVPPLLLLTLVENAVKHGVSAKRGPGLLRYQVSLNQGALHLRVENTGTLTDQWQSKEGLGLAHSRERLALLFGPGASLSLKQAGELVRADVTLPQQPV
jgi:sensor histidine kinase YesM